jgi:hypothetical protein
MTNLSTEAKAELQRMIDIGATHMRAQGEVCVDRLGDCVYRGPNDSKCFIGALIPDDHYVDDLEGQSMTGMNSAGIVLALDVAGYKVYKLLQPLQEAQDRLHDYLTDASDFLPAFEVALILYCSEYELDYTAPGETL